VNVSASSTARWMWSTLIPLQVYLIIRTFPSVLGQVPAPAGWDPHFADSPVTFYLWCVGGYLSFLTHYSPQYEFIFWSHLWFVPRLLVISLVTLPLLLVLQGARGTKFISWLAARCEHRRGAVFLFAMPLGLVLALLGWQWQGWQVVGAPDSSNMLAQLVFYAIIYLYGFIIYADKRMRLAVRRDGGVVALALGVLAFIITQLPGVGNQALAHDYSADGILAAGLRGVAAWLCIIGVVGLGMRFLGFTNQFGKYLTEASYPFYVLHLAVLYLVGLPLLAGGVNPVLAFLVMVTLTYVITLAVYDVLIRRIPPARLLFGMKKRQASAFG
jgi:acyltransferase-like protein